MKQIQLANGGEAIVDDEDFEYLNQWRWYKHKRGGNYYAERVEKQNGKPVCFIMHNVIMKPEIGMLVDHIHHNTLDNRKSQLRICTKGQNNANRSSASGSSSKYLGVGFEKDRGWTARIRKNKIGHRLGTFKTEKEAAIAYNKKAIEFHGEFANLNKITE